jgi:membrane protein DedA with SNARE-associated domain
MSTAEVRSATVNMPATAQVLVHLPDDTYLPVVGYFSTKGVLVLETVLPEDAK